MATIYLLIAKYGGKIAFGLATIALALGLGYLAYKHVTDAAYDRGVDARTKQFDAALAEERTAALAWKKKYETRSAEITARVGEEHAQNVADVGARADALLVRGPGAAASCPRPRDRAGVPAVAGGYESTGNTGTAADAGVHADEGLVGLPWDILVQRARDADASRDEALTWRKWYREHAAAREDAIAQ